MDEHGTFSYARAADGAHLAYRVSGSGPIDVLEVGGFGTFFSMEASEDQPRCRQFEESVARFCRLIRFDSRGVGLSDPLSGPPSVEQSSSDALAVLDAVGSTRAALIGTGQGSPAAIRLAHAYPERFDALVLVNPFARAMVDVDYEIGLSEEAFAQHSSGVIPAQAVGSDIDLLAPSLAGDPEVRRWWVRESRRGATPANAAAIWTYVRGVDVRSEARALRLPTLVVRCLQNGFVPAPFGGWLVDNVPGARAFDLPVADYVLWAIPWEHPLAEIEEFLTGSRDRSAGQHFFAAVMFTDIVDSTARNAAEGNRAWLDRLSRHDALIRQQIRRFGGNEIKGMGDGVLATFPAPSMALRCADAVASGAAEIGIAIRASVHAAEIEQRDNDVFGLGVTIAARALAYAGPGEVVTSATVVGLLTGSEFQFELRGIHELKGVPGEWPLYVLTALHAKG